MNHSAFRKSVGILTAALIGLSLLHPMSSMINKAAADSAAELQGSAIQDIQPVISAPPPVKAPDTGVYQAAPSIVMRAAEAAVRTLGKQAAFEDWAAGQLQFYPLGPGTHSWLVHVNQKNRVIGYMIFTQQQDGTYLLNEYGAGDQIPYSMNTLEHALERIAIAEPERGIAPREQSAIQAYYTAPMTAYWAVRSGSHDELLYIDAFTGEELPLKANELSPASKVGPESRAASMELASPLTDAADAALSTATADLSPYEHLGWLTSKPLPIRNHQQLEQALASSPLVYSATGANYAYGGPLTLSGLQRWKTVPAPDAHTATYVRVTGSSEAIRYVPASRLLEAGSFYTFTGQLTGQATGLSAGQ